MLLALKISIFIVFIWLTNSIFAARTLLVKNNDTPRKYERQKRWLIFPPNGGTMKYVAGYLGPIDTPKFINCNAIRNFQYQYDLPANLSQIYRFYANWTRPKSRSLDNDYEELMWKPDSSRNIAYDIMEKVLSKEGKNGHQCLLRTICEVAETPLKHNGLVGELLEIFFTPGKYENIHEDYRDARKAGLNHIGCTRMYPDCPFGHGILDTFSVVKDYNFMNILYNW